MWRRWLKKCGVLGLTLLITLVAVLLSDILAWLFETLAFGGPRPFVFVEASLIPLVLSPPIPFTILWLLAKLERTEQELRLLSSTDPLTQAYNRRYILERAEAELSRVRRQGGQFAVLLLDIDHFKQVNDTYGHLAGDTVLRAASDLFCAQARLTDVVGRYGGEEFIALLPDTGKAQALDMAERFRASLAAMSVAFEAIEVNVTVSIGVACGTGDTAGLDAVLAQADQFLYQAKRDGRNRVVA